MHISETGLMLIAHEGQRVLMQEGYHPLHDDEHTRGELAGAAVCYGAFDLRPNLQRPEIDSVLERYWPWDPADFKPKDPLRNLVRAGYLISSEINRRLRAGEHYVR